jgi:hypothetical protein
MARIYGGGLCRAPGCNKSVRANAFHVHPYCYSCAAIDIRYGDPRQKRITRRELHRPLRAVARLRKRNAHADWHLMAENWNQLVRKCQDIANSKDADILYRRKAANLIVQIAGSIPADRAVDVIAACYILEGEDQHNGHRRFVTDLAFKCCLLHALRRDAKAGRVFHVGGKDCRSHSSYRVLHKRTRDIACDLIVEHMSVVGGFIARAELKHQEAQAAHKSALMETLTSLI